jgi:hypothetical protein
MPSRHASSAAPRTAIPPKTDPPARLPKPPPSAPPRALSFEELLAPAAALGQGAAEDLTDGDFSTLAALRGSMEKGALVLRSLAELCVEKGLFTREEMRKRNRRADRSIP